MPGISMSGAPEPEPDVLPDPVPEPDAPPVPEPAPLPASPFLPGPPASPRADPVPVPGEAPLPFPELDPLPEPSPAAGVTLLPQPAVAMAARALTPRMPVTTDRRVRVSVFMCASRRRGVVKLVAITRIGRSRAASCSTCHQRPLVTSRCAGSRVASGEACTV